MRSTLLFFGPAIVFLMLSYSMYVLNWFDGRHRTGLPLVATILAFMAVWMGSNDWRLFLLIAALDIGSFLLVRPWTYRGRPAERKQPPPDDAKKGLP